jgi:TPR repeat protein
MYDKGQGVTQSYVEAFEWYMLAAKQGHTSSQMRIGLKYYKGEGVPQDYVLAHKWCNLAAAQGNLDAEKARDIAASAMTQQQVAEAQMLARECLARKYKG